MKYVKKILKVLASLLLIGLIFVLMAASAVWFFPNLIVSAANFNRYARPFLEKSDIHIHFKELEISSQSLSFWEKKLKFTAGDLCFQLDVDDPVSCFSTLSFDLKLDLESFRINRIDLHELVAKSEDFKYSHLPDPEDTSPSYNPWPLLNKIVINTVDIGLKKFSISTPEETYRGKISIKNTEELGFIVAANIVTGTKKGFESANLELKREKISRIIQVLGVERAKAEVVITKNENAEISLIRKQVSDSKTDYKIEANYNSQAFRIRLKSDVVHENKQSLSGHINGLFYLPKFLSGPMSLQKCHFAATIPEDIFATPENDQESAFPLNKGEFKCNLELLTRYIVKDQSQWRSLPKKVDMILSANVAKQKSAQGHQELAGNIKLEVGPFTNTFMDGSLVASYDINFTREDADSMIDFDPIDVQSNITVTDFRTFAKFLNSFALIIPSPLNVLEGKITTDMKGQVHPMPFSADANFAFVSNLKTKVQALDVAADGKFTFVPCDPPKKNAFLNFQLDVMNMKMKLPNIDFKDPPKLIPDARFKMAEDPKLKRFKCGLDYIFNFQSKDKPIYLLSDLLKVPLPVRIKAQARSNKKPDGYVEVRNYSTTLFRRKGTIENFYLNLNTRALEGRIRVDYSEYKIFILLSGDTQSVRVALESDPPLARQQVISVLLFGKTLEGLESEEAGSVRDMDAAAKDGALTLASLYLFASTPVESIGYNPHTAGLTAKVKLGDGTTLNVGVNKSGLSDVGFTRRLSKHWRIQTTLKDPSEESDRSAFSLIEWFHRF